MKFKKSTKYFGIHSNRVRNLKNTNFNHYTTSKAAGNIFKEGLKGSRISGYVDKDDLNKKDQYDMKKIIDFHQKNVQNKGDDEHIYKLYNNGMQKLKYFYNKDPEKAKSYRDPKAHDPEYAERTQKAKIHNLETVLKNKDANHYVHITNVDRFGEQLPDTDYFGKEDNMEMFTPVRVVYPVHYRKKSNNDENKNIDNEVKWYEQKDKNKEVVIGPKMGKWDIDESRLYPAKNSEGNSMISPDKLKLQLPFGSVNKYNKDTYIKDLKDVDPSKFDASDKYTRRVYNLYAKKNGLPTLKEPK